MIVPITRNPNNKYPLWEIDDWPPSDYLERGLNSYGYPRMKCDHCHKRPEDVSYNKRSFSRLAIKVGKTQEEHFINLCNPCDEVLNK